METRESETSRLAAALAAAQRELKNPAFDKVNTAFGRPSGYTSLAAVLDAVRPVLAKHGLAVAQLIHTTADCKLAPMISVTSSLRHTSGEVLESTLSMPLPGDPQKMVALTTYMRRVCLTSLVGVAGADDDDGNAASVPHQEEAPRAVELALQAAASKRAVAKAAPKAGNRLVMAGTVEKVTEKEKITLIKLESGEVMKAWNDLDGLAVLTVGKTYEFTCEASKNPQYPEPVVRDFREAPKDEEVPF
jgi:hypothetical protein